MFKCVTTHHYHLKTFKIILETYDWQIEFFTQHKYIFSLFSLKTSAFARKLLFFCQERLFSRENITKIEFTLE